MTFQAPNYAIVDDNGVEEEDMSSHNHSLIQGRVSGFFNFCLEDFTAPTELSLDMTAPDRQILLKQYEVQAVVQNRREFKPDIAIFYARDFDFIDPAEGPDSKRVTDVPLTCCEIVSPSQSSWEILNKFRVYFALGVKSCWMLDPNVKEIWVYTTMKDKEHFFEGEVVDGVLKARIPLNKIFGKKV